MNDVEARSESAPVRIGDAERESAVAALGEHYSLGRLTSDEFEERLNRILVSQSALDLAKEFEDLPDTPRAEPSLQLDGRSIWRRRIALWVAVAGTLAVLATAATSQNGGADPCDAPGGSGSSASCER